MILYHGSNVEIDTIKLEKCRPFRDFGQGFYLTNIKEQAFEMAKRTARLSGGKPIITFFEIDDLFMQNSIFSIKDFGNEASEEWALFVLNNRKKNNFDSTTTLHNRDFKYDIIHGPVANDDMSILFQQFEQNFIDIEMLKRRMTYKKLSIQYSFHTEKAILLLSKKGVING